MLPKVKIKMEKNGDGEIFLDGHKLLGVDRFSLHCEPGQLNSVYIHIVATEIEVEMDAQILTVEADVYEDPSADEIQ